MKNKLSQLLHKQNLFEWAVFSPLRYLSLYPSSLCIHVHVITALCPWETPAKTCYLLLWPTEGPMPHPKHPGLRQAVSVVQRTWHTFTSLHRTHMALSIRHTVDKQNQPSLTFSQCVHTGVKPHTQSTNTIQPVLALQTIMAPVPIRWREAGMQMCKVKNVCLDSEASLWQLGIDSTFWCLTSVSKFPKCSASLMLNWTYSYCAKKYNLFFISQSSNILFSSASVFEIQMEALVKQWHKKATEWFMLSVDDIVYIS